MAYGDTINYDNPDDKVKARVPGTRQPGVIYPASNPNGSPQTPPSAIPPPANPNAPPTQTTTILPPDANQYPGQPSTKQAAGGGPAGIDPRLAAIYQKYGMTPGERGSGFADWQYWQDKPSQWQRLEYDLQGTGTDQPTGTPGSGAWQNSGRNAGPGSGTPSMGGGYTPLAGTQSMNSQDAINYLNGINQSIGGGNLTPDQIQEAAKFAGYQEGQPVTGDQLNRIVAEMYRRAGKTVPTGPTPGQPGTGPATGVSGGGYNGDVISNGVPDGSIGDMRTAGLPSTAASSQTAGLPSTTLAGGSPASGDGLLNYLIGRGTGQTTDATLPNLKADANDPIIKNQVDAYRNEQTRSQRSELSREAEKGNATTNLAPVARSLAERGGQATGAFEGQVMQSEITARRQEIQQALQLGTQYLTEQQRQALQRELQMLDIQSRHFMQLRDLQERGYEFDANDQFRNSPLYGG